LSKLSSQILPLLLLLLAAPALAQSERSVTLITVGAGDEVWEKFGHNMIEIRGDPGYGRDVAFNWGLFDFDQPHFLRRFMQGRMLYTMRAIPSDIVLDEYRLNQRQAIFQKLNLTPRQIDRLIQLCEINRTRPDYHYDYFRDNCSTRVRDMLDQATDGELKRILAAKQPRTDLTYRQHTVRLTQNDLLVSLGIDLAMGPDGDRPLSNWEAAFLPSRLSAGITPLVTSSEARWPSLRPPEPEAVPDRRLPFLVAGVLGSALMASLAMSKLKWFRRFASTLAIAWLILGTLGSVLMLYLWGFTDHVAAYANQNLWQFSPVAIAILIAWWLARRVAATPASFISAGVDGMGDAGVADTRSARPVLTLLAASILLSLIGLVGNLAGVFSQQNLPFILLALPLHLAAGLTVMRSTGLIRQP